MTAPPAIGSQCRNCGATVADRYCPSCGQETRLALPTAREFLREAAGRYVALDGRLWRSLFGLVRPGFLTREYFEGRRRRYIRPARLFLVLSIALFAVIRFAADPPIVIADDAPATGADAATVDKASTASAGGREGGIQIRMGDNDMDIDFGTDAAWARQLKKRLQHFNRLPRQDKAEQLYAGALRFGPYAALVLLPASALLLQIVYIGRRRRYPERPRRYAEHLVFAAHNHAFLCLVAMLAVVAPQGALRTLLLLVAVAYFGWSLHAVYGGRWIGVVVRGFVVAMAYTMLFGIAIAALVVTAALLG